MEGLESDLNEHLEAIDGPVSRPRRVVGFYRDSVPSPALYIETVPENGDVVPFIVHNLRYYEDGMDRWGTGIIETIVLNELHELTHWAMTDEELEDLHARSVAYGRPDGHVINPRLFGIIDWLRPEYTQVYEPDPPLWRRAVGGVRSAIEDRIGDSPSSDASDEADATRTVDDGEGDAF